MNKKINPIWLSVGGLAVVFWIAVLFPGEQGFMLAMISVLGGLAIPVGVILWIVWLVSAKKKAKEEKQ